MNPITADELRADVVGVLNRHHVTLADFLVAALDEYEDPELRDLWLMTHDALVAAMTITDGFGNEWLLCTTRPCGLQVVRPGWVQCWCDADEVNESNNQQGESK